MAKLKKIAEIKAYYGCEAKEVVETLENKGFSGKWRLLPLALYKIILNKFDWVI